MMGGEKKKKQKEKKNSLLIKANKKGRHIMHALNVFRVILYPWNAFFYPYKMHGYTKVGTGAYIYIGNHFSMWDIFYPARTTWEGIHFFAKDSLMHAPVIGYFAKKIRALGVVRDGSDARTLMDALRILKNGEKISLFPEGTRNRLSEEEFLPFRGGAALLAIKTKTPVIPFVICTKPKVFRKTHVVFGEPMELSQYYDRKPTQDDYAQADEMLRNKLYELRENFRAEQQANKDKKKKRKCKS